MSWPYLPVNPDCQTPACTPCSTCPTTSNLLTYSGPNLSYATIDDCDTLSVSLQKIDTVIGAQQAEIVALQAANVALELRVAALETYH